MNSVSGGAYCHHHGNDHGRDYGSDCVYETVYGYVRAHVTLLLPGYAREHERVRDDDHGLQVLATLNGARTYEVLGAVSSRQIRQIG